MFRELPLVGLSRLLSFTSEGEFYLHVLKKESATIDKNGVLDVKISKTEKSPLVLKTGEFGSIVLEAIISGDTCNKQHVNISWMVNITSDCGIIVSGLQGNSVYYLHYPNRTIIRIPLNKTFWGIKIEDGSQNKYSLKIEFDIPCAILKSSLLVEVGEEETKGEPNE